MADFMLLSLDDELKEKLRRSAARNGRSLNAELCDILRTALTRSNQFGANDFRERAADIRKLSSDKWQTPSEDLLRDGRKER